MAILHATELSRVGYAGGDVAGWVCHGTLAGTEGLARDPIGQLLASIQRALLPSPGMVMNLSIQIRGVASIYLEGFVTRAGESAWGMAWLHGPGALTGEGVSKEVPR